MRYRLAQVEYLNTLPFTVGLQMAGLERELDVRLVSPASCAALFADGLVEISLCPVGALPDSDRRRWSGRFCHAAE
jgi:hypothetical protein